VANFRFEIGVPVALHHIVGVLRKYDGLGLEPFAGEALFLGPTMFVRFSRAFAISGAWGVQVAGHAVDVPGSLDLTNFTRHQALFRLEYNF